MTKSRELKEVEADRDYWKSFIKHPDWQLHGWTYRDVATFLKYPRGSLELTASHIEMLGLNESEIGSEF